MLPNDIYMGIVYDSLRIMGEEEKNFYINLKPKCGYTSIIQGECFTTYGEIVDASNEEYYSLDNIRLEIYKQEYFLSNPIVFLQANDQKVAHSGDITSLIYQKLGASGFITDGNVRDIDIIENMKFPVFCRGENPIDAIDYWALTKYNCPICIDGINIEPKDFAFASKDGVIIVKKALLENFKNIALQQLEREKKIRYLINNTSKTFEEIVKESGRW